MEKQLSRSKELFLWCLLLVVILLCLDQIRLLAEEVCSYCVPCDFSFRCSMFCLCCLVGFGPGVLLYGQARVGSETGALKVEPEKTK